MRWRLLNYPIHTHLSACVQTICSMLLFTINTSFQNCITITNPMLLAFLEERLCLCLHYEQTIKENCWWTEVNGLNCIQTSSSLNCVIHLCITCVPLNVIVTFWLSEPTIWEVFHSHISEQSHFSSSWTFVNHCISNKYWIHFKNDLSLLKWLTCWYSQKRKIGKPTHAFWLQQSI